MNSPTLDKVMEAFLNSWHTETPDRPRVAARIALQMVVDVALLEERRRRPEPELLGG